MNTQRSLLILASICLAFFIASLPIVAHVSSQIANQPNAHTVGAWTLVNSPTSYRLYSVDGVSPADVWAVGGSGYRGAILHWNGSTWVTVTESLSRTLYSISMAAPTVGRAVGGDQRYPPYNCFFLRWDGSTWVDESGGEYCYTYDSAYSVYMLSPTDFWTSRCYQTAGQMNAAFGTHKTILQRTI